MAICIVHPEVIELTHRRRMIRLQGTELAGPRGYHDTTNTPEGDLQPWLDSPTLGTSLALEGRHLRGFFVYRPIDEQALVLYDELRERYDLEYDPMLDHSFEAAYMVVTKNKRREGIGALLLQSGLADMMAKGTPEVYTTAWGGRAAKSYGILRAAGFEEIALYRGSFHDGKDSALLRFRKTEV